MLDRSGEDIEDERRDPASQPLGRPSALLSEASRDDWPDPLDDDGSDLPQGMRQRQRL
jgi:hypothetical protein